MKNKTKDNIKFVVLIMVPSIPILLFILDLTMDFGGMGSYRGYSDGYEIMSTGFISKISHIVGGINDYDFVIFFVLLTIGFICVKTDILNDKEIFIKEKIINHIISNVVGIVIIVLFSFYFTIILLFSFYCCVFIINGMTVGPVCNAERVIVKKAQLYRRKHTAFLLVFSSPKDENWIGMAVSNDSYDDCSEGDTINISYREGVFGYVRIENFRFVKYDRQAEMAEIVARTTEKRNKAVADSIEREKKALYMTSEELGIEDEQNAYIDKMEAMVCAIGSKLPDAYKNFNKCITTTFTITEKDEMQNICRSDKHKRIDKVIIDALETQKMKTLTNSGKPVTTKHIITFVYSKGKPISLSWSAYKVENGDLIRFAAIEKEIQPS